MPKKALSAFGWIVLISATCFGQSSFQGLTPGVSMRDDVARSLGPPVRSISTTLVQYAPSAGIANIEVEYRAGSGIVDRIEVYFVRPVSRPALIQKLGLPPEAEARKTNGQIRLVEYFGASSLLALTYAAGDAAGGVSQIGYYSRELFDRTLHVGASACSGTFAGQWDSTYGEITIRLDGDRAAGAYSTNNGRISGTVIGSILQGEWRDQTGRGNIKWTLSPDGHSFTGRWTRTEGKGNREGNWGGRCKEMGR